MKDICIGIDIGGTQTKGVLIADKQILYKTSRRTLAESRPWRQTVKDVFEELHQEASGSTPYIGISAPGIADTENRSIACMPVRLPGLEGFDWSSFLNQEVFVLNDAHAALHAESQMGVGKEIPNIVLITLGTGVGGGLLINGKLHQGYLQRAGHLGHITVDANQNGRNISGMSGSLEDAIGEATLDHRSCNRFQHTYDLVKAYQEGDTWATFVWLTSVRKLALAIASFCNAISPDLIILAGGLTKAKDQLMQPLSAFMDLNEWRPNGQKTPIKLAKFEEYAGAVGAALFSKSKTFTS